MASKESKSGNLSCGSCLVAIIGVCMLPLFPIGTLLGLGLIMFANGMGSAFLCGNCGNTINPESRLCPTCKEPLE